MNTILRPSDFFDLAAEAYNQKFHEKFYRRIGTELIAKIPSSLQAASILEIGAGTGFTTSLLKERFSHSRITALDPSPEMLKKGRSKLPNVKWINRNLSEFADETFSQHSDAFPGTGRTSGRPDNDAGEHGAFDLIVSSMAYHWLNDCEREELIKLAANGALALALPVTDGSPSQGNMAVINLIRGLGIAPQWPRHARRPSSMRAHLEKHFSQVIFYRLNIHEEYENTEELAGSLYDRGVLFALFSDRAVHAKEMLASQKVTNIAFNWTIGLFMATNPRGSLLH